MQLSVFPLFSGDGVTCAWRYSGESFVRYMTVAVSISLICNACLGNSILADVLHHFLCVSVRVLNGCHLCLWT